MRILAILLILLGAALAARTAEAEVTERMLDYEQGGTALHGSYWVDPAIQGRRPGVIVAHAWWGLDDQARNSARKLAELGYAALAIDMYGTPVTTDRKQASAWAGALRDDRMLMRERAKAGLELLAAQPGVDPERLAAIGYCFGGSVVLEMARAGMDLDGVVSFHGGLQTPTPAEKGAVKAKILVLHGADDRGSGWDAVEALMQEFRDAGADYEIVLYGDTVHSFTSPEAGNDPSTGSAYNEQSARRAWDAMRLFMREIFGVRPVLPDDLGK